MAEREKSTPERPTGEWWRALTEPAATLLTGAAAAPVAGVGGLLSLLAKQDPKAAADVVQRMQSEMTYEPRTVRGSAGLAGLGAAVEPMNKIIEAPGRMIGREAPATGALTTAALGTFMPFRRVTPRRMTAYHGSPHDFDEFDIAHINSGEGAQAFAHGLYYAERPEVAAGYRDNLSGTELRIGNDRPLNNAPGEASGFLRAHGGNITNALDEIENYSIPNTLKIIDQTPMLKQRTSFNRRLEDLYNSRDYLQRLKDEGAEVKLKTDGKLYTVDIPHSDYLLDWDKPLKGQPKAVRDAVVRGMRRHKWSKDKISDVMETATGQQAMQYLMPSGDKAEVAQTLRKFGVPGVKYFDRFSRRDGEGTSNYVIFHHDDVVTKHKEARGGLVDAYAHGGKVAMPIKRPDPRTKHFKTGGLAMALGGMAGWAGVPALLTRLQDQRGGNTDEKTTLQPYQPLPAPTSGSEHGEPGSVTRMLWDRYQIVDPTATNYDQFKPVMEDPYRHMAVDDPTRLQYQQWDTQQRGGLPPGVKPSPAAAPGGATAPGGMYGTPNTGSPYRDRLAAHQARIRGLLAPRAAMGGPVRMAMGGITPMDPTRMQQVRDAMAGMGGDVMRVGMDDPTRMRAAVMPPEGQGGLSQATGAQPSPMGSRPYLGPAKSVARPPIPPGMMFPPSRPQAIPITPGDGGSPAGPMGPPLGGPRVPPNLQGMLQKMRMMARPPLMGQARQGAIGTGDQQGGLARALQSQTGRPPTSRRMAFPGTR